MALGLFRDRIVASSEINRHPGQVLREAYSRPITVTRPHGDLVIMNRELAATMARAADVLPQLTRAFVALLDPPDGDQEGMALLSTLNDEEWTELASELAVVTTPSLDPRSSHEAAQAVVHEWIETKRWVTSPQAMAALHREEAAAMETDGIPVDSECAPTHS